jgi:antitoxin VapB
MAARSSLFKSNRSQAVRLPKELAFPDGVKQVAIRKVGKARIILPADAAWDDFFDAPGVELGEREQPEAEQREQL